MYHFSIASSQIDCPSVIDEVEELFICIIRGKNKTAICMK